MRRQKIKKKGKVVPAENFKTVTKAQGTPQFYYIKNCIHNLKGKSCPMCKLIEKETADWLRDEAEKSNMLKMHNFFRRAEMRYGLLRDWSKNQLSSNADMILTHSAEIILCASVVDALSHAENIESDLSDLDRNLRRRIRIQEVGDYAATYIQCRLRGMCCRQRVRDFMLRRFEYYPETNRRAAYFFDKRKGDRWYSPPSIIRDIRPTTPRTIQRRISSQSVARDRRLEAYKRLEKNPEYTQVLGGGPWKAMETNMTAMRQIAILRDVIHSIMKALSTKRRNNGERPAVRHVPNPDYKEPAVTVVFATGRASKNLTVEDEEEGGVQVAGKGTVRVSRHRSRNYGHSGSGPAEIPPTIELQGFPFWFTLSNPAPPARQIYLSLALLTDPLAPEHTVALSPEEEKAHREAEAAKAEAAIATGIDQAEDSAADNMDINHRLQLLDRRAWDQMMCMDADEMIIKIAKAEEIAPAMSSCVQIAEDDHHVWTGTLYDDEDDSVASEPSFGNVVATDVPVTRPSAVLATRSMSTTHSTNNVSKPSLYHMNSTGHGAVGIRRIHSDTDDEGEKLDDIRLDEGLFIPCQLVIHPFYALRSPVGMFRMFFIDGMCLAVCHTSPWVYYSEVWKHRGSVMKSLFSFAHSSKVMTLVRMLMDKANDKTETVVPVCQGTSRQSTFTPADTSQTSLLHKPSGSCLSIVLPDESALFGSRPEMKQAELTGDEYMEIERKYKFVRKMKSWKDYKKRTLRNFKKPDSNYDNPLPTTEAAPPAGGAVVKLEEVSPAESLLGTRLYELSCLEVPKGSLLEKTRKITRLYPKAANYKSLLKTAFNEGKGNFMTGKYFPPSDNEFTANLESEIPPPPNYNMVVLDVHAGFPVQKQSAPATAASTPAVLRQSKMVAPPKVALIPLTVDVHQIVGVFSATSARPPAAVDTGLFDWDEIRKYAIKAQNLREIMSNMSGGNEGTADGGSVASEEPSVAMDDAPTTTLPAQKFNDDSLHWTCKSTRTGVFSTKVPLASGNCMQVRIVGRKPARDYLEEIVPRKLRLWMGLKY